jgi:phosphoribosylaminoimidazolecarboxamide formyltransferase/IMP cyclohydrolase
VIIAPDATEEAIAIIAKRKNLRLLLAGSLPDPRSAGLTAKTVAGGLLVQSRDNAVVDDITLKTVTRRGPTDAGCAILICVPRSPSMSTNTIVYARISPPSASAPGK